MPAVTGDGVTTIRPTFFGKALDLPGASGDFAHTPDSAGVSVTGDIDIHAHATLYNWTPSQSGTLVAKRTGAADRSFWFYVFTNGRLAFAWSVDGSALIFKTSTAAISPTPSAGSDRHLRATLDVDAGSTDNNLTFYTSTDGVSWTQLGNVVNTAGITSIFDGIARLTVGAINDAGNSSRLAGIIHSAQVYDGIDGTLVADSNPSHDANVGDTTYISDRTGETWTVAGSAAIVSNNTTAGEVTHNYAITGDSVTQVGPSFPAGAVSYGQTITGDSVTSIGPTFPTGVIATGVVGITGDSVTQIGPTFPTGVVATGVAAVTGDNVTSIGPTFFGGVVATGVVGITGDGVTQIGPTFSTGELTHNYAITGSSVTLIGPSFPTGVVASAQTITGDSVTSIGPTFPTGVVVGIELHGTAAAAAYATTYINATQTGPYVAAATIGPYLTASAT